MALQFSTTDKEARSNGVKILVYGESGVGKTTLCATAPAPIILSAESGLLSLGAYRIPVIKIDSFADLNEAFKWVTESKDAAQFQTICLDSITEIAEVVLANAKKTAKDPRQAYGELIDKMNVVIKGFRDIPGKNVYMAAKMEYAKDELTGALKYGPSMPGSKLGQQLPYLFDEVFRLGVFKTTKNEQYRALVTQPELQYVAKDRSGKLGSIEQPNLAHIISKITGATA